MKKELIKVKTVAIDRKPDKSGKELVYRQIIHYITGYAYASPADLEKGIKTLARIFNYAKN